MVSTANRADFCADRQPEDQIAQKTVESAVFGTNIKQGRSLPTRERAQSRSGAKYFGQRGEAATGRGPRLLLGTRRLEPGPNSRNYNDVTPFRRISFRDYWAFRGAPCRGKRSRVPCATPTLGIDRKTIRKYVAPTEEAGLVPGRPPVTTEEWAL